MIELYEAAIMNYKADALHVLKKILYITGKAIKYIFILFFIFLPFALIGAIINYFKYDFAKDAGSIIQNILKVSYNFYSMLSSFIEQYPESIFILGILFIILLIKSLSSHIILRKHNYKSFFKAILHFFVVLSLTLSIVYYEDILNELQLHTNNLNLLIHKYLNANISINVNRLSFIFLLIIYVIVWINNRLLWVLSIFLVQLFLIYIFYNDILKWLNDFPTEYIRLLQGILPFLIVAPYIFLIWIFRDNDKFMEYSLRQEEVNIKSKEIRLREKELRTRETELNLKQKEFELNKNKTA